MKKVFLKNDGMVLGELLAATLIVISLLFGFSVAAQQIKTAMRLKASEQVNATAASTLESLLNTPWGHADLTVNVAHSKGDVNWSVQEIIPDKLISIKVLVQGAATDPTGAMVGYKYNDF